MQAVHEFSPITWDENTETRTSPFNSSILHVEGGPQDADEDEVPAAEPEAFWEATFWDIAGTLFRNP